jgi:LysM repeat protein
MALFKDLYYDVREQVSPLQGGCIMRRLLTIILLLAVFMGTHSFVLAQGGEGQVTHTVQPGENLYRISLQYGTTVTAIAQANNITNASLIYVGQVLKIPGATAPVATATPQSTGTGTPASSVTGTPGTPVATLIPTTTPAPTTAPVVTITPLPTTPGEIVHVVQPGETLFRIALQYNLLAAVVAQYNGIPNPSLIYVGQQIRIPPGATLQATPVPSGTPVPVTSTTPGAVVPQASSTPQAGITPLAVEATPEQNLPLTNTAATVGFAYGIEVHLPNQDMPQVILGADELGMQWAKQRIEWALYEPTAGAINWEPLDAMVDAMDTAGLNILLSVTSAPDWARDTNQEAGPPTDYSTYANFIGALAERYAGRVDAYEIWSEPNIRQAWNTSRGISAASYVEMLRLAYTAIKTADPDAVVVTGGLAPTGVNDPTSAIDDRLYLTQMYQAGVTDWADAIGAHPFGWANPPDSVCCQTNRPQISGWDDHASFFFRQTLEDYRAIMMQNGDTGRFIWATEFGWGSNDGLNVQPPVSTEYVTFTSMDEQAQYTTRAFQIGSELGYVGPMFLYNLNFCQAAGVTSTSCLWGLLDPAGNPRPAYQALQAAPK